MQIDIEYPIRIEHWMHLPFEKFMGSISDNGYNYILGITSEDIKDPECCYFNIWIEKKMINETNDTIVFYAKTYSCFKIRNNYQKPSSEFYFGLIEKATYDFALQFHQRTRNTNLAHHKIPKPSLSQLRNDIEKTIEIWNRTSRNRVFLRSPNWQTTFRDLPEIPEHKKWRKDSHTTLEQDISLKLLNKLPITVEEGNIFIELTSFYKKLDEKLRVLNYQSFSSTDFENFKNYIFYVFNYQPLITNNLTIYSTYRLVINDTVTGKNESITNVEFLKYPKLEIVQKLNKYNRANTPNTTVFYSAGSIDTALKEIRPRSDKLVSVGIWQPKNAKREFISYPISHGEEAMKVNQGALEATRFFEDTVEYNSPLFMNYMRYYFKLLGNEFAKKVDNNYENYHYEYLISALFSERILSEHQEINDETNFKYDCIIYPSVGNDYLSENLAIIPSTLETDFYLSQVIEFEVDEPFYERPSSKNPDAITLAKIKKLRKAKIIREDGQIEW